MAQLQDRYPQNVPGAFYVDSACIDCDACRQHAPAHFVAHADGHSYVTVQPTNAEDEQACEEALDGCPVGAIGRDGLAPPPPLMRQLLPDVWACGYPSSLTDHAAAYVIVRPGGNWLIDVPAFEPALVAQIEALGDLRYIFISHADTAGEVDAYKLHFGAEVVMHAAEASAVYLGVDRPFEGSFQPSEDLTILHTPGHTPGSSCLIWHRHGGCLFSGDTLGVEEGRLAPARYEWTADWPGQLARVNELMDQPWTHCFPARGADSCPRGFAEGGRENLADALTPAGIRGN